MLFRRLFKTDKKIHVPETQRLWGLEFQGIMSFLKGLETKAAFRRKYPF